MQMTILLVAILVAAGVSFVCSVVEAALLSLTPSQIADISANKPSIGSIWQNFKNNIGQPIAVILIINTTANMVGASIAGAQFNDIFGGKWLWVFSILFALAMVQFAEILPKTIGVRFNRSVALIAGKPLNALVNSFSTFISIAHWLNRPFEGSKGPEQPTTVEEISALAGLARISKQISSHQESIIKGASKLSRLTAKNVMIPVEQVSFLSTSQSLMDAIIAAHIDSHTRFPVCLEGNRDRIAGFVNFKEMVYALRMNPADPTLTGIIRPLLFSSPDEPATSLLERFTSQHVHMAIVQDAAGKTLGLITLEDIVEELTGELEDEFDRLPRAVREIAPGSWVSGGGAPLRELAKQTGLALPDSPETTSAWLVRSLGHIPKAGDTYRAADAEFTIRRTRRAKVFELAITRL
jgi:CBS domain containing-hemolysin-like protein